MSVVRVRSAVTPAFRPSVLIVDADADTRALYRVELEALGYDVMEASDGRDAIAKALARPPALVVLELTLPFVDGYALCEIFRRDPSTMKMPVLVVTAEARATHARRARQAGADNVLVKPVLMDVLLTEAQRLISTPVESRVAAEPTHRTHVKSFMRFVTTSPPRAPLQLVCPSCDRRLTYEQSYVGGVSARHAEQWDDYTCTSCGVYQYRHRTRTLRRA